jgi:hypothetical protein
MPNHVIHAATITGAEEVLKEFYNAHIQQLPNGTEEFNFNTIVPMPAAYNGTEVTLEKILGGKIESDDELAAALKERYGFGDWYYWKVANWGTKWGAYDGSYEGSSTGINMVFQTAWSTPFPILNEIAELYPELNWDISICEEGGFYAGKVYIRDGKVIDELSNDPEVWKMYAEDLFGWVEDDEE